MKPTPSYLIRIYRRDARTFAGLVEDVRTGRSRAFGSLAELCRLLAGRRATLRPAAPAVGRDGGQP